MGKSCWRASLAERPHSRECLFDEAAGAISTNFENMYQNKPSFHGRHDYLYKDLTTFFPCFQ